MAVTLEFRDDVAVITVDQPLDTASPQVRALLPEAAEAGAVVLHGGARLSEVDGDAPSSVFSPRPSAGRGVAELRHALADLSVPVVAALAGSACGPVVELALACHGRVLAAGGELGRVSGSAVLVGRRVPAAEALRTGLVDRVVPACAVLAAAVDLANECRRRRG
ncbi:hypothetical protein [Actinosynnema sp. NPDC020468]|uniref:hypothetical protein n=1 Tax=Actinosynnema sp. NPDC020468 TaxID=3154488 RepID=UPI0033DCB30C